jgi:hypothetical protein
MTKCTCSEYQLYQVGCDCGFVEKVDVWTVVVNPRGYASEEGPKTIRVFSNQNVDAEVCKTFGACAKVVRIIKPVAYIPPVSQTAAMAYSRNDNS